MASRGSRVLTAAIFAAALLSMTPPASAQYSAGQDELRSRLNLLEAEVLALRRQVGGGGGAGGALPAGDFSSQMLARLNRLEDDMRALTGRFERLEFAQRRLSQDIENRIGDFEYRITVLEGGDPSTPPQPGASDPYGGATLGEGVQTLGQIPSGSVGVAPGDVGEQQLYDQALALLQGGSFGDAQVKFQQFMNAFPDSQLYPDAQYWLGETYFVTGEYQTAARTFLDGFSRYPDGQKAPENLLKLGMTLGELGKHDEACLTLSEVSQRYPDAAPSVLRRSQLEHRRLGCS